MLGNPADRLTYNQSEGAKVFCLCVGRSEFWNYGKFPIAAATECRSQAISGPGYFMFAAFWKL